MAADLLYSMNVIRRNKVVCVKPCDMISEWIGGTGTKAMEVIRRAYNGVLFIDEAYGIATMDRGEELLNILVQEMEENSDKLVVILAGYTHEMRELMKANPGLASRIGRHIQFDDYNLEELAEIFLLMCQKEGFSLDPDARDELEDCIASLMTMEFFGNARAIRNMLQELKEAWSEEYYQIAQEVGEENVVLPKMFRARHFERILPPKKEVSIRDLIGLETMKQKLEAFKQQALFQRHLREKGITGLSDFSMHMIFTGNPGTGKTTVAKLIADDLYSIGMLKTNRLVVAERKDLVSYYGDTAKRTADLVNKAVGGVLFIDEAYSLADRSRGGLANECIEVLLTAMEEHKSDTVFIFAGYVNEMQDFLATNPGIQSRIGYTFHFEDYTADELTQMFARKMQKTGFNVSPGALNQVHKIMEYFQEVRNFGNGRFVDHVIHQTISRRAKRDFSKQYRNIQQRDIPSIRELIETAPTGMHLYDPGKTTQEELRKTAVHELGHAFVMLGAEPKELPKIVSIRNHAGSLGRVAPADQDHHNRTEKELLKHIAILLGGMNAEKVIYGTHDTGCLSDYRRAKNVAADMIKNFGMVTYGETPKEIIKSADAMSMELILQHKDAFEPLVQQLLQQKEMTGTELEKALKKLQK
ncbi:MAG: AAA family ATPase [Oscillospiraceae bacterium]|nr:AAA family ATPase [Oscillospiraceae bacterium]